MKIVTAVNEDYIDQLHPLLGSFYSFTDNRQLDFMVFIAHQSSRREVDEKLGPLRSLYPLVDWQPTPLDVVESRSLIKDYHSGLKALYFDGFRAWISQKNSPCLWLDADIVIQSSLRPLMDVIKPVKIAMAKDFTWQHQDKTDFHWRMQKIYESYYFELTKFQSSQATHKLNNGVLYTSQGYFQQWQTWYDRLRPRLDEYSSALEAPEPYGVGATNTLGQAIWNFLLWEEQGLVLESSWNRLVFQDPRPGHLLHYAAAKTQWEEILKSPRHA